MSALLLALLLQAAPAHPAETPAVPPPAAAEAAHALVQWSSRRSTNAFLGAVLGGMVGRMALMLAAVVAGVLLLDLPKVPLAVSLLSYFVLFLAMELTILHRRTSGAPPGTREAQR